ncbi:MAG: protein-disulfide reductase DsbD domain-containing protein [Litoreibacter sp.]|uniref:protein-disulfide reductase DsbD domain-containing protein n=1 Tax=Litoreibacter sp. TaxID=1969459 RepID=UPI0032985419
MSNSSLLKLTSACLSALALLTPAASAQVLTNDMSEVVTVDILPGWLDANGIHYAGLKFTMAPEWKTYWRAPGDGGLPTLLEWDESENLDDVKMLWPTPQVFRQHGLRSIGYDTDFILPLALKPEGDGPIELDGLLRFGLCKEICLPVSIDLQATLQSDQKEYVSEVSQALANRPMTAALAQVKRADCSVDYLEGRAEIRVQLDMPAFDGKNEALVIEAANKDLWISEPKVARDGNILSSTAEVLTHDATPFELDLTQLRMTVITTQNAVDIFGCD